MTLFIKHFNFSDQDINKCLDIRLKVFVQGQNVPQDEEVDGLDPICTHFLATINNSPVATARIRYINNTAKIERVAVLDKYQGLGIGKELMLFILDYLKSNSPANSAKLGSQTHAIEFYEKLGFCVSEDEEFLDGGIPHKNMYIELGS